AGNSAQSALAALLNPILSPSTSTSIAGTDSSNNPASSTPGTSAQDALWALLGGLDVNPLSAIDGGNTPQDALLALLGGASSTFPASGLGGPAQDAFAALLSANNAGSSSTSSSSSTDLALALALYQSQVDQQLFASVTGLGGTTI